MDITWRVVKTLSLTRKVHQLIIWMADFYMVGVLCSFITALSSLLFSSHFYPHFTLHRKKKKKKRDMGYKLCLHRTQAEPHEDYIFQVDKELECLYGHCSISEPIHKARVHQKHAVWSSHNYLLNDALSGHITSSSRPFPAVVCYQYPAKRPEIKSLLFRRFCQNKMQHLNFYHLKKNHSLFCCCFVEQLELEGINSLLIISKANQKSFFVCFF